MASISLARSSLLEGSTETTIVNSLVNSSISKVASWVRIITHDPFAMICGFMAQDLRAAWKPVSYSLASEIFCMMNTVVEVLR